jgi:hypothetical protein
MAYMRGEFYVWGDGENTHINDVVMPDDVFDQLVAMRWAQMSDDEREVARKSAVENYGGNFGCDPLCKEMGVQGAYDELDELIAKLRSPRKENT